MLSGAYEIDGARPLRGQVRISGSKNASLPLMVAALLGDTPTTLRNLPLLSDTMQMKALLEHLGAAVEYDGSTMTIDPAGFQNDEVPFAIMNSMRASFYAAGPMLAKLGRADLSEPGGCSIGERPVDLHLRGFEALGVQQTSRDGYMKLRHKGLRGARMSLLGEFGTSVGATCNLLMAASLAEGATIIKDAAREPEVVELCRFLNTMGAKIAGVGSGVLTVFGVNALKGIDYRIAPDRIEAGTWAIAALVTGGDLVLEGIDASACEPTLTYLREWGALIEQVGPDSLRVRPSNDPKRPLGITTAPYPGFATDMQSAFTTLLALTPGNSIIRETIYPERMNHGAQLNRMGARIRTERGLIGIAGVHSLCGSNVEASDLRAGAALVLAALAAEGRSLVRNVHFIERGYEHFVDKLLAVGAVIQRIEVPAAPAQVVVSGPQETVAEAQVDVRA